MSRRQLRELIDRRKLSLQASMTVAMAASFLWFGAPSLSQADSLEASPGYVYLKCQGAAPGFRLDVTGLTLQQWFKDRTWGDWSADGATDPIRDGPAKSETAKDTPEAFIFTRYDKKGLIDDVATVDRRALTVSIQGFEQRPLESRCAIAKPTDFKVAPVRF